MRLLSLDASTKATGFSIFNDQGKLENYGLITASSTDLIKRINKMTTELEEILLKSNIDKIIMEEVRPETGKNIQTYKALSWLQGAINILVHNNFPKVKIDYIYPSSWRRICGILQGAGIKRETLKQRDIDFVNKTYGININSDDIADSICIGYAFLEQNTSAF